MQPWLYVVLVGAVILVYSSLLPRVKTNTMRQSEPAQGQVLRDIEETMEHFMGEMEEENKELLKLFADLKADNDRQSERWKRQMEALEDRCASLTKQLDDQRQAAIASQPIGVASSQQAIAPVMEAEKTDVVPEPAVEESSRMIIKDRYAELFLMHEQGKSIEYIAKKLGMNKGEVLLIMQLSVQEERMYV